MMPGPEPNRTPVTSDPRIHDYLDHVCAPLVGLVPYARRQELRVELRAHLEALIATHEELGSSPEVAVVLALRQFGDPCAISRQWAREWLRPAVSRPVPSATRAIPVAFACFGAASLLTLLLFRIAMGATSGGGVSMAPSGVLVFGGLLPMLAGLMTGLLAPARHALGTFFALALLVLPFAALGSNPLLEAHLGPQWAESGMWMAFTLALFWLPIGPATAALGGLLRTRLGHEPKEWILQ